MKFVRTLSMIIALAGASTVYADTPAKAPAEKKAPDKAPAKEELSAADAAKVEKFFNDFVDAIVKNQDACPKMATAINSLLNANEAWIAKMADSGKDLPPSVKEKLAKRQGEMMTGVMKCKDDKDVNAAMMRFASFGKKKMDKAPEKAAPPAKK